MNNDLLHYSISEARFHYTQFMQNLQINPLGVARSTVSSRLYDWGLRPIPHQGHDRTAYIMGLSGTGRWYINEMMRQNIGRKGELFSGRAPPSRRSDIDGLQWPCHNQIHLP